MTERHILLATAVALVVAGPAVVSVAALPQAEPGGPVFVIASPFRDAGALVAAAGGRLVGPVQPRLGRLAASPDPRFPETLRAEGAWFVVSDPRLLAFCGVSL